MAGKSKKGGEPWLVWLSWLEHHPINPKGHGFNPQSGHNPGLRVRSTMSSGHKATDRVSHIDVALPPSLPLPHSKINEHALG